MTYIDIKVEHLGKKYIIGHQAEPVPYLAFARRTDAESPNQNQNNC